MPLNLRFEQKYTLFKTGLYRRIHSHGKCVYNDWRTRESKENVGMEVSDVFLTF